MKRSCGTRVPQNFCRFFSEPHTIFFRARLFGGGPAPAGPPPKSLARKKNRAWLRKKSANRALNSAVPGYRRSVSNVVGLSKIQKLPGGRARQ